MLFDEDPVELMSSATAQFHIAPDKDSLTRVSDSLHSLATARQSRIDQQSSVLASLTRRLNNLSSQHTYEEEHHDAGKHAAEMLKMDTEKFKIAKGVNDAEIESERLSGELAALRQQLQTLEKEGVEGRKTANEREDEIVLKLQFYRGLGIDAVQDKGTGEWTRAIVRNAGRGDVCVVEVDGRRGRAEYANACWEGL